MHRCEHCEAVAARPVEPQIHDPMLNQMEKPDCITSQDDIVWGFVVTRYTRQCTQQRGGPRYMKVSALCSCGCKTSGASD